jgi:UDP-2-acetamido-3-amino-2,3-dideoxy-glucuronate N-acetyltransferase
MRRVAERPANDAPFRMIAEDVELGEGVIVHSFTNLYGCRVGAGSRIGPFVEIQEGSGVEIADEVFVGHGVVFINDRRPRATTDSGAPQGAGDWELLPTTVGFRASLGSGAVILGGLTIGEGALVGAGAVVTKDVPPFATMVGNPARVVNRKTGADAACDP